jgi:nicotinate-nucleotide adenylyltransferase
VTSARRVGIFGGTFDPVHNGHLQAAAAVRSRFKLDRVLFIPSRIPPHKRRSDMAPAAARLAMVEAAVRGTKGFSASPLEVRSPRTSYSIHTLAKIRKQMPAARLFFILGADAFGEIKTWREWRRVLGQCIFIVTTRPGTSLRAARAVLMPEYAVRMAAVRKTSDIEALLRAGRSIFFLRIQALAVSSSDIRRRVGEGRPIESLVPAGVAALIRSGNLYRGQKNDQTEKNISQSRRGGENRKINAEAAAARPESGDRSVLKQESGGRRRPRPQGCGHVH